MISNNPREQIGKLLCEKNIPEEELEKTIDKIYQMADIFFDLWLASKNNTL